MPSASWKQVSGETEYTASTPLSKQEIVGTKGIFGDSSRHPMEGSRLNRGI